MDSCIFILLLVVFCFVTLVNVEGAGLPVVGAVTDLVDTTGVSLQNIINKLIALVTSLLDVNVTARIIVETLIQILEVLLSSGLLK